MAGAKSWLTLLLWIVRRDSPNPETSDFGFQVLDWLYFRFFKGRLTLRIRSRR